MIQLLFCGNNFADDLRAGPSLEGHYGEFDVIPDTFDAAIFLTRRDTNHVRIVFSPGGVADAFPWRVSEQTRFGFNIEFKRPTLTDFLDPSLSTVVNVSIHGAVCVARDIHVSVKD